MIKFPTVRIVLALVAQLDLEFQQMDVRTAFFNREIEEEIYMEQPEGFVQKGQEHLVCKLNKSLYGLKQSVCKWNWRLDKFLKKCGFIQLDSDPNMYKLKKGNEFLYLLVYVDDLLLALNSLKLMEIVKNLLKSEFEMSDLGEPTWFLGLEVRRDRAAGQLTIYHSISMYLTVWPSSIWIKRMSLQHQLQ